MSGRSRTLGCALATTATLAAACTGRGLVVRDAGTPDTTRAFVINTNPDAVDLLFVIDNTNTRPAQTTLMEDLDRFVRALVAPPCTSRANPAPHECDAGNANDVPVHRPVRSLHLGVVSTDLGTPGFSVPGCANSDTGDDGRLNPIRYGGAIARHEPWTSAPPTFGRPLDCTDPDEFPPFLTFQTGRDIPRFVHDAKCNVGLYTNGCGLESPLEAAYRGLVTHDARDRLGNSSPHAGFARDGAVLAILVMTDEEDMSVRDCRFANGDDCSDATSVYDPTATNWAAPELNLRSYLYQSCSEQDPTWPIDRYVAASDPTRGWLSLAPGHPERVVFGAIVGVPLALPRVAGDIDWTGVIGVPAGGEENYCARDSSALGDLPSAEGPVSMEQANRDPQCEFRVVPGCRQEGSPYDPTTCTIGTQYFAHPGRRIAEVARRFDAAPLCHGEPCRNSVLSSICTRDFAPALDSFASHIARRLVPACVAGDAPIVAARDSTGQVRIPCEMRVTLPDASNPCSSTRGQRDPETGPGVVTRDGVTERICVVDQLSVDASTGVVRDGAGWSWRAGDGTGECLGDVEFTEAAALRHGETATLNCR